MNETSSVQARAAGAVTMLKSALATLHAKYAAQSVPAINKGGSPGELLASIVAGAGVTANTLMATSRRIRKEFLADIDAASRQMTSVRLELVAVEAVVKYLRNETAALPDHPLSPMAKEVRSMLDAGAVEVRDVKMLADGLQRDLELAERDIAKADASFKRTLSATEVALPAEASKFFQRAAKSFEGRSGHNYLVKCAATFGKLANSQKHRHAAKWFTDGERKRTIGYTEIEAAATGVRI